MHNRKKALQLLQQYDEKIKALHQIKKGNPSFVLASLLCDYCDIFWFNYKRRHIELTHRIFSDVKGRKSKSISPDFKIGNLQEKLLTLDDELTRLPDVNLNGDYYALLAVFLGYYSEEYIGSFKQFKSDSVLSKCWRTGQRYIKHQVAKHAMELTRVTYNGYLQNYFQGYIGSSSKELANYPGSDHYHKGCLFYKYADGLIQLSDLGLRKDDVLIFLKNLFRSVPSNQKFYIVGVFDKLDSFNLSEWVTTESYLEFMLSTIGMRYVDLETILSLFPVNNAERFKIEFKVLCKYLTGYLESDPHGKFADSIWRLLYGIVKKNHSDAVKNIIID